MLFFFFQAEDGIRDPLVTGVQTCALPISKQELGNEEFRKKGDRLIPLVPQLVPKLLIPKLLLGNAMREAPASRAVARSEERRVGKECRSRWSRYAEKKRMM